MKFEGLNNNPFKNESLSPAIEDMRIPAESVLRQIGGFFERGDYGIILGMDASGRLFSLLISEIANDLSPDGMKPDSFFTKGKVNDRSVLYEYAESLKSKLRSGSKILIVDDTLYTGKGISGMRECFAKLGVGYDIAVMVLGEKFDETPAEGERIFYGKRGRIFYDDPIIHGDYDAGATINYREDSVHSSPQVKFGSVRDYRPMTAIRSARQDIKVLTNQLLERYRSAKDNI